MFKTLELYMTNGTHIVFNNYEVHDAVKWLRNNGYEKASCGHISSCISRKRKSAYGFIWSETNM